MRIENVGRFQLGKQLGILNQNRLNGRIDLGIFLYNLLAVLAPVAGNEKDACVEIR